MRVSFPSPCDRERGQRHAETPEKWSTRPCSPFELDVQRVLGIRRPGARVAGMHVRDSDLALLRRSLSTDVVRANRPWVPEQLAVEGV